MLKQPDKHEPTSGLSTGTQISDQATVVFDVNPPVSTAAWVNTIDNTPPVSSVSPLPLTESIANFTVQWLGTDVGSGIQAYNVYVSDNGGSFTLWQQNTTATSATYPGQDGHTYGFYSIATDLVGNTEPAKSSAEATTTVQLVPSVTLSPTSLTFGNQPVGSTSSLQPVTLSNTGSATLSISAITASGDFAQTNSCGGSVDPGNSCTISVTFTPTTLGTRTGSITISDNATDSPQTVALTGVGTEPIASVSPGTLTFGAQNLGTTSAPQAVTLSNTGNAPLTVSSVTITGDFAQTNNCGNSVAAGGSCTINVTFTPTGIGTRNGTLTVTDNSNNVPGSQQTVSLTGTGINPGGSVSPTSLSFGSQVLNTTSVARKVTLTSTGTTSLIISGITIAGANAGDFTETNNCPASMAPGAKCTINVTFTPTALGARTASLAVTDNAKNSPQTVALSGTGVAPVTLTPATLAFGNVPQATSSTAKNVTLTNNQTVRLNISSITTNNPDYAQTNTCGSSLAAKAHCTISVTFTPSIIGTDNGTLSVADNASNSPQTASLTGKGIAQATVMPTSMTFAAQKVGTTSAPHNATLTNNLATTLTISSITFTGANSGDFGQTNTCGGSVAAHGHCTISVTFTPTATGTRTATLDVNDSANNSPQTVSLTGTGK